MIPFEVPHYDTALFLTRHTVKKREKKKGFALLGGGNGKKKFFALLSRGFDKKKFFMLSLRVDSVKKNFLCSHSAWI